MLCLFSDMSWKRETMVEGEHLKVHIQDTSDNVSFYSISIKYKRFIKECES